MNDKLVDDLKRVAFLQFTPPGFSFKNEGAFALSNITLGGLPHETVEFLLGKSNATLFLGTGVNTPFSFSSGLDVSFLSFLRASYEVAKIFGVSVLQDVCDVLPESGVSVLAKNSGLEDRETRNQLVLLSDQLQSFSYHAHPCSEQDVVYEAHVVSELRRRYPESHADVTKTANILLSEFLEKGDKDAKELQPYRLHPDLIEDLRAQGSGYLGQQIADMWLMRRNKNVFLKLGWAALDNRDFKSDGRLHVPGHSELYFDYFYRSVERSLDSAYGLQGVPPMGFIYSKSSVHFDGRRCSPYFLPNSPNALACVGYGALTYDVVNEDELNKKFLSLAQANKPKIARGFIANLMGLDRSGTWHAHSEWERFLEQTYRPLLKKPNAYTVATRASAPSAKYCDFDNRKVVGLYSSATPA